MKKGSSKPIKYEMVDRGWKTPCMECTSHKLNDGGYPMKLIDGRQKRIHRYIYQLRFGEIESDVLLHHLCENPKCINSEHLLKVNNAEHRALHARFNAPGSALAYIFAN